MLKRMYELFESRGFENIITIRDGKFLRFEVYNPLLEESLFMVSEVEDECSSYCIEILSGINQYKKMDLHDPTYEEFKGAIDHMYLTREGVL